MATVMEAPRAAAERKLLAAPELNAQIIAHNLIEPSPTNPRQLFAGPKMDELIASVKLRGVKVPITVRPHPSKALRFEIVAGERRWRASVKANRPVPAVIENLTDNEVLELQAIENDQRDDVHPLERAEHYKRMMKAGYSVEQIGEKLNKKAGVLYRDMKLAELSDDAKKQFLKGVITTSHAILIARLPEAGHAAALKYIAEQSRYGHSVSVRNLEEFIERELNIDLTKAPFSIADNLLVEAAGSCTVCPKNTAWNKELFPELAKKQLCTDLLCYRAKVQADFNERKAEYAKKGKTLVALAVTYSHDKDKNSGGIATDNWQSCAKDADCKGAALGYLMESGWHGLQYTAGQIIGVCLDKKCKEHWRTQSAGGGSGISEAQKQEQRTLFAKRRAREEAMTAIVAKVKAVTNADLGDALRYIVHRMDINQQSAACKILGLEARTIHEARTALDKFTKDPKPAELHKALIACIAAPDAHPDMYSHNRATPVLDRLSKTFHVDTKKIESAAIAATKAKAKAAKKKPAAKAKKRAKK